MTRNDSTTTEPRKPWRHENAERFNGRCRSERVDRERFSSPRKARLLLERWLGEYGTKWQHISLVH